MNTKKLAQTAAIAALTCLAGMFAHLTTGALVPFSVLPVMVFLAGIVLGPFYGAMAMIVYIILGLLGLPVFASPPFGGMGYILKPTFGYLIGYVGAAYVTGLVFGKGGLLRAFLGVFAGLVILYTFGLIYLFVALNLMGSSPTVMGVLAVGFTPFILLDLVKAGIAAWVGNKVVKGRGRHDSGI